MTTDDTPPNDAPPAFAIVGIGASAGGLKALSELLGDLPGDTGMAFVVIQHLDAAHDSVLPALLARSTRLVVEEAADGTAVLPDRVYVITPNTGLAIAHGVLRTVPRARGPAPHLAIDDFLCALAADRPGQAIGVILSGTGSDGTRGIAAIKAARGITFAQDDSAGHSGMPQSAIAQGHVDFVLPPRAIARELGRIARDGFARPAVAAERADDDDAGGPPGGPPNGPPTEGRPAGPAAADPAEIAAHATLIRLLQAATGIDFTHYRATTITRRTQRRMALVGRTSLADYAAYVGEVPGEIDALARDILINVTSFFRDEPAFAALRATVFPALTAARANGAPLRLWVVGCSTGQEVYSLAIELLEHLRGIVTPVRVQIFATDISDWALAKARLGWYPAAVAEDIPDERLARYFTPEPGSDGRTGGFRIAKAVRDLCVFARHDVTADTPFSQLDLISCRNVLIYLGPLLQRLVLPTFHFALRPGGILLLGASEAIGPAAHLFATVDERNRVYRALPTRTRATPPAPAPARATAVGNPPPAAAPPAPQSEMQRAADQVVLGRLAPPGVLVTAAGDIIQFRGDTAPYLRPAQGEASLALLTMVPFAVAEVLREALGESRRLDLPVHRERIAHHRGEDFREIAVEIIPIKLPTAATCFLVLFSGPDAVQPAPAAAIAAPDAAQREAQLRDELAAATDYVHSLVEQNQALGAQLAEAQGEAQSSSEEFRSTTEELQTAKEEVESSNEELITINEEMRRINDDLGRASAALRASGELTAAIVETMRYPLLVLAPDLRVESANQAFYAAFRVDRQETIGRLVYDLGDGQWDIPELRRLLEDILPGNSVFDDFEVTHEFRGIGRRTMWLNARRIAGNDARTRLIVLVIADITDRARVAKELQDVSDELRRSNGELDQFAAVASHDLQEPLRTMTAFASLLQHQYGGQLDARAHSHLDRISASAQRMSDMIAAVLTYSRVGQEAVGDTPVDSAGALDAALGSLAGHIGECRAAISQGPLPTVTANREQLIQLFQNLVGNALKYRAERPPAIAITAVEAPGEWIFSIADNGIGMAASDHERIFQLFQRVHSERIVRGTGIGLATCKKIVERHHGRIWVESELEVGSTFFFALPR